MTRSAQCYGCHEGAYRHTYTQLRTASVLCACMRLHVVEVDLVCLYGTNVPLIQTLVQLQRYGFAAFEFCHTELTALSSSRASDRNGEGFNRHPCASCYSLQSSRATNRVALSAPV